MWKWEDKERVRKKNLKEERETGEENDGSGKIKMVQWEKIFEERKADKRVMQRKSSAQVQLLTAVLSIVLENRSQESKKNLKAAEVAIETIDSDIKGHEKVVCVVK